ncbi:MAG: hypothetical protein R3234_02640 [Thermoanaerobaculia bacterium]|nr:hypothetical protein [Thermoanaerobaculia bacterium]
MQPLTTVLSWIALPLVLLPGPLFAGEEGVEAEEPPSPEVQIAGAVLPAPPDERESATVLGYTDEGELVTLRKGEGRLICLADDPTREGFHSACYHRDLEPFMARGRELREKGLERSEVQEIRKREIEEGSLFYPEGPRALYSLTGPAGSFDPETEELEDARRVYVLYIPYATEESTGLTSRQMTPGGPWIMSSGEPWAHVMVVQAPESEDSEEEADPKDEREGADGSEED